MFFLIVNAVDIRCVTVDDCPKVIKPLFMWCIDKYCQYYFSEIPLLKPNYITSK